MDSVEKLIQLLPNYEEIKDIVKEEPVAAYTFQLALENIKEYNKKKRAVNLPIEDCSYLVQCLVDRFWEKIHTGHFSKVPLETRKIYALANYIKLIYLLFASTSNTQVLLCSEVLDKAVLVGCAVNLYTKSGEFGTVFRSMFKNILDESKKFKLPILKSKERQQCNCDVQQIDCPSVEYFVNNCFQPKKPALLLNTISHWPAFTKWRDLNYLLDVAGEHTVPVEIGANYANENWSTHLTKISEFLKRQFSESATKRSDNDLEYLAQHDLFDQIPLLKRDILIPDYCAIGAEKIDEIDVKAWLGPKGTISQMHYDPKHNLLCQVFGTKKVILAAPEDTQNLYPYETAFLENTSRIDAENLNFNIFPLTEHVTFYHLTLQEGDCLYIPPKWWHNIRAESESFSVSFWWE